MTGLRPARLLEPVPLPPNSQLRPSKRLQKDTGNKSQEALQPGRFGARKCNISVPGAQGSQALGPHPRCCGQQ